MISTTAPGKSILLGEHAVVYGRPAIAVPVWQVAATATIQTAPIGSGCTIHALDVGLDLHLSHAAIDQPLAVVTRLSLQRLAIQMEPDWQIDLTSTIPIAGGLGSGAALSTALVRAIFAQVGKPAEPQVVSEIVYASETLYHGTASGIDNTVIAFGTPIWFVKGQPPQTFSPGAPLTLLIADSGIPSPTKETVGDVRRGWQANPQRYEDWFDQIGRLVTAAKTALEAGEIERLGQLFSQNHSLLQELGVSSPLLDRIVTAAKEAGALGAKLSGGGRGGNVLALVTADSVQEVQKAMQAAGAHRVLATNL